MKRVTLRAMHIDTRERATGIDGVSARRPG